MTLNMPFNWVDYILLAVFLISILSGLVRGGIRELLSLLTWIAAFIIAGRFAKPLALAFSHLKTSQSMATSTPDHVSLFAMGLSFFLIFICVVILGSLLGYFTSRVAEGPGISIFNRLMGGIFGLVRGYLVNFLIIYIVQLSPIAEQPYWADSSIVAAYQPAVHWLSSRVQPEFESITVEMGHTIEKQTSQTDATVKEKSKQ